jgi:hypothetical protein
MPNPYIWLYPHPSAWLRHISILSKEVFPCYKSLPKVKYLKAICESTKTETMCNLKRAIRNAQSAMRNPHCAMHSRVVTYCELDRIQYKMAEMEPGDLRFPLHPEDGLHLLQGPGGKGGVQQKILILFVPIHFVLKFSSCPSLC